MTQSALALSSGVSSASLSKWEREQQLPEVESLQNVAEVLGIPLNWFLTPLFEAKNETPSFFRSNASTTKTVREMAEVKLNWGCEVFFSLEKYLDFQEVNLIQSELDFNQIDDEYIEKIASNLRNHWGLGTGPILDLTEVLEQAGVVIIKEHLGYSKMDGLSKWVDGRPLIYLVSDKESSVRSRFDAAHELGHLVLHSKVSAETYNNKSHYSELERQANYFAGCFLMPSEKAAIELAFPTLEKLKLLKLKWKTSIGMMIKRAEQLNLIDEEYKLRLWKNYSARGWRKGEPFDDSIPIEQPRLINEAVNLLISEGGFTKEYLLKELKLSKYDLASLMQLSFDYFDFEKATILKLKPQIKSS